MSLDRIIQTTGSAPITVQSLVKEFRHLGVEQGMTLLVHSSMKSLGGWVCGGPDAVIYALDEVLGPEGTLVMPTHSGDLSDPSEWASPPVPADWWETIRDTMPAYRPDRTPTWYMGAIVECFRKQDGVIRSIHPHCSFAARGRLAETIAGNHSLENALGEQSPLARIYDAGGYVLLLGVGHQNNTSLHLSEYRAVQRSTPREYKAAPIIIDGQRVWKRWHDIALDSDDFPDIGEHFEQDTGLVKRGKIANATTLLMPQKELIDYGADWMKRYRI